MFGRYCMQEVALVFAAVQSLMELHALWALDDPCVVAGGEMRGAQPSYVAESHSKLDLSIAQDVRIGRPAGTLLVETVVKDSRPVLGGEAHPMQGNTELAHDCARVLEVLCGCTVTVVVLFPITHEEPLNSPALLLEEKSRHGGIHSA